MIGVFAVARPVPLLRLLGRDADPDVLPHRDLGLRPARLRRGQVHPLHDGRQRADAGRHHRAGGAAHAQTTGAVQLRPAAAATSWRSTPKTQLWFFLAFALAFAIKVPLFPFHTWLPDAHVRGAHGRLGHPGRRAAEDGHLRPACASPSRCSPTRPLQVAPYLAVLAVIGIIYGALVAMVQPDLKKLVAYSSVSHLGFVVLGICAMNVQGVQGAVYQMLNHGVSTGGALPHRRHAVGPAPHAADRGVRRPEERDAALRRRVPRRHAVVDRAAGPQRLRRRVPRSCSARSGGTGASRRSPRRGVILSAVYMLWMFQRVNYGAGDQPEERGPARSRAARVVGASGRSLVAGDRDGRGARRLPAADGAVGGPAASQRRAGATTAGFAEARTPALRLGSAGHARRRSRFPARDLQARQPECMTDLQAIMPILIVTLAAIATMLAEAFRAEGRADAARRPRAHRPRRCRRGVDAPVGPQMPTAFGVVRADNFALFVNIVLCVVGILTILFSSPRCIERERTARRRVLRADAVRHRRHDAHGGRRPTCWSSSSRSRSCRWRSTS